MVQGTATAMSIITLRNALVMIGWRKQCFRRSITGGTTMCMYPGEWCEDCPNKNDCEEGDDGNKLVFAEGEADDEV